MFDKRPRTKRELKKLYTNLQRKGITDDMAHILIDLCYNENMVMRTSGFYWPGGPDSVLAWNDAERKLTLTPREADPGGTGADEYRPHFRFYSWAGEPIFNRIYEEQEIELPNEEGLFAVYFDVDAATNKQKLTYTKNPTAKEQAIILIKKVLVSYIYWDYENQKAQFFGNDRHGSEVNPQQQLINHVTEYAKRNDDRELQIYGYILNGDGTSDDHVRYKVSPGDIWHDDIKLAIASAGINEEIPVLYFDNGKPRIILNTVPVAYTTQLCYNSGGNSLVAALDNAYVMYHIFATNDKIENQHIVAVVGRKQYGSAAIALDNRINEVLTIREEMPQTGKCYLGSVVYLVSSQFTNTPHAIMVTACNSCGGGLIINYIPITINIESNEYLTINEYNEITYNETKVFQKFVNIINNTYVENITVNEGDDIYNFIYVPNLYTIRVYLNGVRQQPGVDYTLTPTGFQFVNETYPGDDVQVYYDIAQSSEPVMGETPAGSVNGINTDFELDYIPEASNINVFLNGVLQKIGLDFTLNGNVVVFAVAPVAGDWISINYFTVPEPSGKVYNTSPAGNVDGNNTDYVLSATPVIAYVYLNGILQQPGVDYSIIDDTVTFAVAPVVGDWILIDFETE